MAHHDPDVYRDDFELVLRRESAHPNDVWQADHTELDIMVLDETGRPARPWLTVILDDHSRAIPGYTVFLGDPTTAQTALALRQAIWRKPDPGWAVCGVPAVLYSDHGADFTSTHLTRVCADLKVQLIHSAPGRPRGRGKVERLFGTITTELLPTLPGHIPPGQPRPAGHRTGPDPVGTGRRGRPVHRGHLPPAGAPGDRAAAGRPLDGGGLATPDARVAGGAGPAAAHRLDPAQGAARRDPLPRAAVLLDHPRRIRGGAGHHPVRPPGPGRDPRVPPRRVPVPGGVPGDRLRHRVHAGPAGRPEPAAPGTAAEAHRPPQPGRAAHPTSTPTAGLPPTADVARRARPLGPVDPAPGSSCTARTDPTTHGEEHRWPRSSHRRPG